MSINLIFQLIGDDKYVVFNRCNYFYIVYCILLFFCKKKVTKAEFILALILFSSANPYVSQIHFFGLDWIQSLGIKFSFKIDAIGMVLTVLTSFVFLIASMSSKMNIRKNHKFYYSMFLLLMSAILGIFSANDMFVFFLFWELELIPAYFLIGGKWDAKYDITAENDATTADTFGVVYFEGTTFSSSGVP